MAIKLIKKSDTPSPTPAVNSTRPIVRAPADFNPLLAGEAVLGQLDYSQGGLVVMPKLNGVRGVNPFGTLQPRSLKKLKNNYTRQLFSMPALTGLDGELVVGDFSDEEVFVKSTSGVGTIAGEPDVRWYVFDYYHPTATYLERLRMRDEIVAAANHPRVVLVPWKIVHSDAELEAYSNWALEQGYEGLVVRLPRARYKMGRSSDKESILLRYCAWLKGEALILSIAEGEVNLNPSVVNELGYKKKSSHKENKVGSGRAGAFTVKDIKTNLIFNMPVPSVALQTEAHEHPERFIGELAHYHFKPPVKKGGKPRFPQYDGLRGTWDMS